jgi:hypothetical protein
MFSAHARQDLVGVLGVPGLQPTLPESSRNAGSIIATAVLCSIIHLL